ncbi:MAG: DNA polymerase IV [Acidimicrobiales bacterium]
MNETGPPASGLPEPEILHVDMDAFFAAVEVLDAPHLAGSAVVVGGIGARGVVASCSYEARAKGVGSAMPMARARSLCPEATFIQGRHGRYAEISRMLHEVLEGFTPLVEGIALDEAFLDVSGAHLIFGASEEIAWSVRARVRQELGLWCSVGVAATKLVAKLASEHAKPTPSALGVSDGAGVVVVRPGREVEFLHPQPIRHLWGVGPATAKRLRRFGVSTIGDLALVPPSSLVNALGPSAGRSLHDLAWGRDARPVVSSRPVKSVGHEETFALDERDPVRLGGHVVRMSDAVASRLRDNCLAGRTVTLKVRFADFRTLTRSLTLSDPCRSGPEIARVAAGLLARLDVHEGVRLLGVAMAQLSPWPPTDVPAGQLPDPRDPAIPPPSRVSKTTPTDAAVALSFDDIDDPTAQPGAHQDWAGRGVASARARAQATDVTDAVRRRFGESSLGPAALIDGGRLRVKSKGDAQWGPRLDSIDDADARDGQRVPEKGPGTDSPGEELLGEEALDKDSLDRESLDRDSPG